MAKVAVSPLLISFAIVRGLVEAVEAMGVSRDELLRDADIPSASLNDLSRPFDIELVDRLIERAIALTGEPALGLHWWERATFGAFGVVGHVLSVVQNFRAGVELIERYWPLFVSGPLLDAHDDETSTRLTLRAGTSTPVAHRAYMEATAYALSRLLRQCAGVPGLPTLITFDYPEPAYVAEYTRLLRCRVEFDAPETVIHIRRADALHPNIHHAPQLEAQLREFADTQLERHVNPTRLTHQVLRVLRESAASQRSSMEDVAARIGMSERTLRRRLQVEQISFPLLVQRVLQERAEAMLKERGRSVKEIALSLGFADPSAFHRAVRRWTGQSLRALRSDSDETTVQAPGAPTETSKNEP